MSGVQPGQLAGASARVTFVASLGFQVGLGLVLVTERLTVPGWKL